MSKPGGCCGNTKKINRIPTPEKRREPIRFGSRKELPILPRYRTGGKVTSPRKANSVQTDESLVVVAKDATVPPITFPGFPTLCITDLCAIIDPSTGQPFLPPGICCAIGCKPLLVNNFYAVSAGIVQAIPFITHGFATITQNEISNVFTRVAIMQTTPWLIVFIVIFVVLARSDVISYEAAWLFVLLTIIVAVVSLLLIVSDVSSTTTRLQTEITEQLQVNLRENGIRILIYLIEALFLQNICAPNTCKDFICPPGPVPFDTPPTESLPMPSLAEVIQAYNSEANPKLTQD